MAVQMHFLIGDYVTVCSRIKHESSSSDEEHAAGRLSSASHLPLLSNVGYKKTLRLTSEQLVSVCPSHARRWARAEAWPPEALCRLGVPPATSSPSYFLTAFLSQSA